MRVTRIQGRFSLEEYKKIGSSFSMICLVRPWIHGHASVFGSYFAPFPHVGGLPEMTSGKSFVFSALLGSTAILALRQFTQALMMFTHSRRTSGLWTPRSVSELPEECRDEPGTCLYSALLVRQWTPVCVSLLPMFTHFLRESGLRTALHRCDHHASVSLLHWRLGYG